MGRLAEAGARCPAPLRGSWQLADWQGPPSRSPWGSTERRLRCADRRPRGPGVGGVPAHAPRPRHARLRSARRQRRDAAASVAGHGDGSPQLGDAGRCGRWARRSWPTHPALVERARSPAASGSPRRHRARGAVAWPGRAAPLGPARGEHPRSDDGSPGLHRLRRGARRTGGMGVRGAALLPGLADG